MNFLFARKTGGRFVLRFDDTDQQRASEEFARASEHDLAWLGLGWDLFTRQSDRLALYAGAAEKLKRKTCGNSTAFETPCATWKRPPRGYASA